MAGAPRSRDPKIAGRYRTESNPRTVRRLAAFLHRSRPMSFEILLIGLAVGATSGWLSSIIVRARTHGPLVDMVVGATGALITGAIFRGFGWMPFAGVIGAIVVALIGAVTLLVVLRLVTRRESSFPR